MSYKVGDIIECRNDDERVDTMTLLSKQGIDTDFVYEREGHTVCELEVTKIG